MKNKYEKSLCNSCRYRKMDDDERPCYDCVCECTVPDEDDLANCRRHIGKIPSAVSGQNGHEQTHKVAEAIFHGFAFGESDGWPILLEYNCRCAPPWPVKQLRRFMEAVFDKPPKTSPCGTLRDQYRNEDEDDSPDFNPQLFQATTLNAQINGSPFYRAEFADGKTIFVHRIVTDGERLYVLGNSGEGRDMAGVSLYGHNRELIYRDESTPRNAPLEQPPIRE